MVSYIKRIHFKYMFELNRIYMFFCSNDTKNIDVTFEALLEAIKIDDEKMVESVIKNGFNVNTIDQYNKSALHYAAFKGNL